MTGPQRSKPVGLRRLERALMGTLMGVVAFILEKVVMRSIRREGGTTPNDVGTAVISKGAEIDVEES